LFILSKIKYFLSYNSTVFFTYEDVLTIGEIIFAEAYLPAGFYKISKKEISHWGFAWLDENRFEKVG